LACVPPELSTREISPTKELNMVATVFSAFALQSRGAPSNDFGAMQDGIGACDLNLFMLEEVQGNDEGPRRWAR
jgi:hypothetical protein